MTERTCAFYTLGCKLNFSETAAISREFSENGFTIVSHNLKADVYVVNTCTVTDHSDRKCRNIIRKLHRQNPDSVILVTGCYAQLKPDEIARIDGVKVVLCARNRGEVYKEYMNYVSSSEQLVYKCDISECEYIFPAFSTSERTRAFLKVQDGCDYHCTYCTIPLARGKSRNIPIATLVEEARRIAATGVREIVITGVNTGDFGRTTGEKFLDLLKALEQVEGIERYRISSIEPNLLTEEIVDWIASGTKFLPHFHIPLQSGSDTVLARMKRRYNTRMFRSKIEMIRSRMSGVFFGIDVIVGFPGETDELFRETYDFLSELRPAFLHIFPYSIRKNTLAAEMPDQIDERVKDERVKILEALSDRLHEDFCNQFRGTEAEVLFESTEKNGKMYGYTGNYIRVERDYDENLIGKVVKVTI